MWATLLITIATVAAIFFRAHLSFFCDALLALLDSCLERFAGRRWRDTPAAALLLAPALGVLTVFGMAPLFYAVYLSLFEAKGMEWPFVGLGNYAKAFSNPEFWKSFLVTIYYVIGTIPVGIGLSFVVASLLYRIARGRGLFRTLYFLPYVTAVVASATVWRILIHPQVGVVNGLLSSCGVETHVFSQWLLEPRGVLHLVSGGLVPQEVGPSLALCCVILFEIWHSSGFMIVVLLAGLAAIPRDLEDAARIDGANWLQVTRSVTIPLLSPTIFFLFIVSTIRAFQAFNGFYALTGDGRGPLDTTENITVHIFASLYEYGRYGYGAAVATLLAVAIVAMTLVQWRFVGRRVHYE